jgi:hypothetical protein
MPPAAQAELTAVICNRPSQTEGSPSAMAGVNVLAATAIAAAAQRAVGNLTTFLPESQ